MDLWITFNTRIYTIILLVVLITAVALIAWVDVVFNVGALTLVVQLFFVLGV